jgi:molybdopterin molybdotransferase
MRPGKGTSLFLVGQCPVFMLSGGPTANLVGFLKLALPALLRMGGRLESDLPQQSVLLKDAVCGRRHWTRFVFGRLRIAGDGLAWFQADRQASRLKVIGQAQALLTIPEGVERIAAGTRVTVASLM